jgi:hypothetical protein
VNIHGVVEHLRASHPEFDSTCVVFADEHLFDLAKTCHKHIKRMGLNKSPDKWAGAYYVRDAFKEWFKVHYGKVIVMTEDLSKSLPLTCLERNILFDAQRGLAVPHKFTPIIAEGWKLAKMSDVSVRLVDLMFKSESLITQMENNEFVPFEVIEKYEKNWIVHFEFVVAAYNFESCYQSELKYIKNFTAF